MTVASLLARPDWPLICGDRRAGTKVIALAAECGATESTMGKALHRSGAYPAVRIPTIPNRDWFPQAAVSHALGDSVATIAARYGVSPNSLYPPLSAERRRPLEQRHVWPYALGLLKSRSIAVTAGIVGVSKSTLVRALARHREANP